MTSHVRPRRWSGIQEIMSSDGHWSITFALQGSFHCPTSQMSFDLQYRDKAQLSDNSRIQRPAVQHAREGRWHVYHLTVNERKETTEENREWQSTLILHESRMLNRSLVDKIMKWFLEPTEHHEWYEDEREDILQTKAFCVEPDDWSAVHNIETPHEMIFIGHPKQQIEDIVNAYEVKEGEAKVTTCPCMDGKWCSMEKIFNHGCVLSKLGSVRAYKDRYGFVLVIRELPKWL